MRPGGAWTSDGHWLTHDGVHPNGRGDNLDFYKAFAEKLNAAGAACHQAGLKFAYHNHAFEFEPLANSTPLDTILAETDPVNLSLELDVFWVSVAGHDPAAKLNEYKGRVALTHLKDKQPGFPAQFSEGVAAEVFREVGAGSIDFASKRCIPHHLSPGTGPSSWPPPKARHCWRWHKWKTLRVIATAPSSSALTCPRSWRKRSQR